MLPIHTVEEATIAASTITNCEDEASLNELLRAILAPLGVTSHIFATILRNDHTSDRVSHRFLIGCMPQLCQVYNGRKWYLNDPCLIYSRSNIAVIPIRDLPLTTDAQRRFIHDTMSYRGFKSGVIVPAHTGTRERMGTLYIGSTDEPEVGNARFLFHRVLLRAIALELLEWWITRIKKDAQEKYLIDNTDLRTLRLLKSQFTAKAISEELGLSIKTVRNRVKRMKESFEAKNISELLNSAACYGLLD